MQILKPGETSEEEMVAISANPRKFSVFLGGSIEMGKAIDWQTAVQRRFEKFENVVMMNPRRDDWDASWKQDPTPGTKFYEQVSWELAGQDVSDLNVYFFAPETKSPITLLEMGSYGTEYPKDTIVCCPKNFYRYGNVKMFCMHHDIIMVENMEDFILEIGKKVMGE